LFVCLFVLFVCLFVRLFVLFCLFVGNTRKRSQVRSGYCFVLFVFVSFCLFARYEVVWDSFANEDELNFIDNVSCHRGLNKTHSSSFFFFLLSSFFFLLSSFFFVVVVSLILVVCSVYGVSLSERRGERAREQAARRGAAGQRAAQEHRVDERSAAHCVHLQRRIERSLFRWGNKTGTQSIGRKKNKTKAEEHNM
jgi:hypothetical protein